MTDADWKKVQLIDEVMDEIFVKYGKSKYQTELIKMVR
jgi:hypothetical protein